LSVNLTIFISYTNLPTVIPNTSKICCVDSFLWFNKVKTDVFYSSNHQPELDKTVHYSVPLKPKSCSVAELNSLTPNKPRNSFLPGHLPRPLPPRGTHWSSKNMKWKVQKLNSVLQKYKTVNAVFMPITNYVFYYWTSLHQ
jgi:hypothetical protein